ncbi:unnamed protein product [Peronospora destructor]|uniref:Uncharacterized protein n=1 Tax=Peronospora destructor TaxID=86335 RepID=A0AAV0UMU8_9STRA|nr:unnamed protein product [Peronospora destructor]
MNLRGERFEFEHTLLVVSGVGDSKKHHPDLLWFATKKPAISTVTSVELSYVNVLELLELSLACNSSSATADERDNAGNNDTSLESTKSNAENTAATIENAKRKRDLDKPQPILRNKTNVIPESSPEEQVTLAEESDIDNASATPKAANTFDEPVTPMPTVAGTSWISRLLSLKFMTDLLSRRSLLVRASLDQIIPSVRIRTDAVQSAAFFLIA